MACKELPKCKPEKAVRIVEEWSKAHPVKTNAMKFEEVFGVKVDRYLCLFNGCQANGGGLVNGELQGCEKCKLNKWWDEPYKERGEE